MKDFRLDLEGAEAALRFLGDAAARVDKPRDMFDEIGAMLAASAQRRFEQEEDPEGNPWPDSLRKLLEGGTTLRDKGRLVGSLTHEPSDEGVAVGTNVIYAAIHQLGGTIRAKTSKGLRWRSPGNGGWVTKQEVTMPRRAFLGVDEDDEDEIEFIAARLIGAETDLKGARP